MVIKFGCAIPDHTFASNVEEADFDSIWVPDHFAPFSHTFGSMDPTSSISLMALPTLPLVLNNTTRCTVGTGVLCPTLRYHPAIIAQYFAQLDYQYPGRIFLGVGTGEAINEAPIFGRFPSYKERIERLEEAIEIMRRLWTSEDYFSYDGKYYKLRNIFLYTKPKKKIPIKISAFGEKTAAAAGRIGDGIILYGATPRDKRKAILQKFIAEAKKAGKDHETLTKSIIFIGGIASDPMEVVRFLKQSLQWANPGPIHEPDPRKVDEMAETITDEEVLKQCLFVPEVDDLIDCFDSEVRMGMNEIVIGDFTFYLTSLNLAPPGAEEWPKKVLPYLREKYE